MNSLTGKVDFMALMTVTDANINGDPINGNRPREDYDGYGIVSDGALKRKLRNRIADLGGKLFVQSEDRADDGMHSLKERASNCEALKNAVDAKKKIVKSKYIDAACNEWYDVRAFGQVFPFAGSDSKKNAKPAADADETEEKSEAVSIGIRGPVTIHQAKSVSPIITYEMKITKSVNTEDAGGKKSSDTMGSKYFVTFGTYVIKGSISCQLAKKTGFSDDDAKLFKEALCTLFENDASAARPDGSCEIRKVIWWQHDAEYPSENSAKIHRSLHVALRDGVDTPHCYEDYTVTLDPTECKPEIIDM
ncbi:MAG: type I-C CRISPR-associated protein Cas7/Csd2 [Eubacteriales bacterium]